MDIAKLVLEYLKAPGAPGPSHSGTGDNSPQLTIAPANSAGPANSGAL
jgi:hypothetical protein